MKTVYDYETMVREGNIPEELRKVSNYLMRSIGAIHAVRQTINMCLSKEVFLSAEDFEMLSMNQLNTLSNLLEEIGYFTNFVYQNGVVVYTKYT